MNDNGSVTFEITNLGEFEAQLRALGATVSGPAVMTALTAGAQLVSNSAKQKAPYVTGNLRRSIHIERLPPSAVAIGTDVVYARRVEYGFVGPDKLGRIYHQPAKPYLRPAIEENRADVEKEIHTVLAQLLGAKG